jgi:hypothetical protein
MPVDRCDPPDSFRSRHDAPTSRSILPKWLMALWIAASAMPSCANSGRAPADWIDDLLERIVPRERAGIPHCEAMVSAQLRLAAVRDSIKLVVAEGWERRKVCESNANPITARACTDSLEPLRQILRSKRSLQRKLADTVQIRAGRCNTAAFEAWREWRALQDRPDTVLTDSVTSPPSFDRLVEYEFASVWQQERIERGRAASQGRKTSSTAASEEFRDRLRRYMGRRGAQNPSAQSYFLLAVLDHREGDDAQALFRLRRIPARDTSTAWKAPVALLYGQILAPTSPDSALPLLSTAFSDTTLAGPAHFLMAQIEERRHRPYEALRHLSAYLVLPSAPAPGTREQAILATARALVAMADPPYRIHEVMETHLPEHAKDTIGLAIARQLLATNAVKQCIEILSNFQVRFPGTRLGEEVRMFLSQVRRNRPGIVVR